MRERKDLKIYLILRFLITLVAVAVLETVLTSLINRTMLPFLAQTYFAGFDPAGIGAGKLTGAVLSALGLVVLRLLRSFLPGQAGYLLAGAQESLERHIGNALMGADAAGTLGNLSAMEWAGLLLLLTGMLLLILLPVLAGAAFYTGAVVRKIRQMEEEDRLRILEAERKQNKLLSDIAHDLRTPLTTVNGYAKALTDGMVSPEQQTQYLEAIQKKSQRMSELLNLLFDYVRLGSEGFSLKPEKTDLCELLRESVAGLYEELEAAGADPQVEVPEEPVYILADRLQLSRVVTNLLMNAMRHNPEGTKIGVFCFREGEKVRFFVADGGAPIEKERAKTLFEPFVMGDESRNSKGGSGLGLSIVKKIADMHGFGIELLQKPELTICGIPETYGKAFVLMVDGTVGS